MKKIFAFFAVIIFSCALSVCVKADDSGIIYKNGEQIELYLGAEAAQLPSNGAKDLVSVTIDDETVAKISDGKIVPVSEGFTYVTCTYGKEAYVHNIIVHSGFKEISGIYINNSLCKNGYYTAVLGKTYQLAIDNKNNTDFSQVKVYVRESYENAVGEDFVHIDKNGKMTVWGVGQYDIVFKSSTNRQDPGYVLHIDTIFSDDILRTAIKNYFVKNNYELACGTGGYTKDELAAIDNLVFTSVYSLNTGNWSSVLPKLQKITFDLRNSAWSGNKNISISNDSYPYEFIGTAGRTYNLSITSQKRDTLKISFSDFFIQSQTVALDFRSVANTTIRMDGKCTVKGGNASNANDGYDAIIAKNLIIEIEKGAAVTVQGGNGGSNEKSGSAILRQGGNGIEAEKLTVRGIGYSSSTKLTVNGGQGGNGFSAGDSGGDGGIGIKAKDTNFEGEISILVVGGSGGNGKKGSDGIRGDDGSKGPSGSFIKPVKGDDGADGTNGSPGGDGGDGSYALDLKSLAISNEVKMNLTGGSGGSGGAGGSGGDGGNGASDTNSNMFNGVGAPGNGGNGGDGASGGSAGTGAKASNLSYISGTKGSNGTKGNQGLGGYGGLGGGSGDYGYNGGSGEDGTPNPPKPRL